MLIKIVRFNKYNFSNFKFNNKSHNYIKLLMFLNIRKINKRRITLPQYKPTLFQRENNQKKEAKE